MSTRLLLPLACLSLLVAGCAVVAAFLGLEPDAGPAELLTVNPETGTSAAQDLANTATTVLGLDPGNWGLTSTNVVTAFWALRERRGRLKLASS